MSISSPEGRRLRSVLVGVLAVFALGACSSASASSAKAAAPATPAPAAPMNTGPMNTGPMNTGPMNTEISASTRMICAAEAQDDLSNALGTKTVTTVTPSWVDEQYSCTYQYVNGGFKLSVKQLSDAASTRIYFDRLATTLGKVKALTGLGQGAFTTKDGSVVVSKDDKVLLVDVRGLPDRFGVPADTRANVAVTVAATIMGCWSGA